jgi:hypothetical protein
MLKHIKIIMNPDADTLNEMVPHYIVTMCGIIFVLMMLIVKVATGA